MAGKEARCAAPLSETARTMLEGRLDGLESTRATIAGSEDSEALHALRIAAKRLRYSLEMFAVCFPAGHAQERADGVRAMQDLLGRIHDLDVLQGLLQERIAGIELGSRQVALGLALAPGEETRRNEELLDQTRLDGKTDGRLGLYRVIAAKADERRTLYDRFTALWLQWEETGFLTGIRASLRSDNASPAEPTQGT